jgi:hypothetical protein
MGRLDDHRAVWTDIGGVRWQAATRETAVDEHRPDEIRDEFGEPSSARFERFEKVLVADRTGHWHRGTILWRDLVEYSQFAPPGFLDTPRRWSQWEYAVSVPDFACCPTLEESRLEKTGEFDPEEAHLGRRFEISFDTGLEADNGIIEGSYRVPGQFWQVFLLRKESTPGESAPELRHHFGVWPSGITGIEFDVPGDAVLDREYLLRAFASIFGTDDWVEVRGPDSLLMR